MMTVLAIKPLEDMRKGSMLLINTILNTLQSLLHTLELLGEACLIMIHAILHRVDSHILDNCKLLNLSAQ